MKLLIQAVLDFKKSVQKASYGYFNKANSYGCCVSLGNAKDKLGEGHCFDFEALYHRMTTKKARSIFLKTVFCHLAIADFCKLESISYTGKGICDLIKQAILKEYVGEKFLDLKCLNAISGTMKQHDDFFAELNELSKEAKYQYHKMSDIKNKLYDEINKNRKELVDKVDNLLSRSNYKIEIPWFEKAFHSVIKYCGSIRWAPFSIVNLKANFSKTFDKSKCLEFVYPGEPAEYDVIFTKKAHHWSVLCGDKFHEYKYNWW